MSQPICLECSVVMHAAKNGQLVNDADICGFPPTYWRGDRWKCPGCAHEIVTGRGMPFSADKLPSGDCGESLEFYYSVAQRESCKVTA